MAISITPGYNWGNGNTVMPTRLNLGQTGLVINCATAKILGRATAGSGAIEEIDCTAAARSILDDASVGAIRTTLGVGTTDGPTFAGVIASSAAGGYLEAADSDYTTNLKRARFTMDGGDLILQLLNDDGSVRVTCCRWDTNGNLLLSANRTFRLGSSYVNTPIAPEGYLTMQDSNGNTYQIAAKLAP